MMDVSKSGWNTTRAVSDPLTDRLQGTRLRLFGALPLTASDLIVGAHLRSPVGLSGRWEVIAPPDRPAPDEQPILGINFSRLPLPTHLGYDIRAWAHVGPAAGSLLASRSAVVDYRQSLINHFYMQLSAPSIDGPLVDGFLSVLERDLEAIKDGLHDLGLRPVAGSMSLFDIAPAEMEALTDRLQQDQRLAACSVTSDSDRVLIVDLASIRLSLFLISRHATQHDELVWYRHWILSEGMGEVLRFGNVLLQETQEMLVKFPLSPNLAVKRSEQLEKLLEFRTSLIHATDGVQMFTLMMETLETYRKGVDLDHLDSPLVAWLPAAPPAVSTLLNQDTYLTLARPIEMTRLSLESLVESSELRLRTLTEVSNMAYNARVQQVLRRLQWVAVIVALLALTATLVVGFMASSNATNVYERPNGSLTSHLGHTK